jgi:EAL and modified HD-GYP domain-containing signal transduction protein
MLSALDQMLETPMDLLADSMELAPDIRAALLRREDFYGEVLSLIEAYEQGSWEQVDAFAAVVGVSPAALPPLYLDALTWASEHQKRQEVTPPSGVVRAAG